MKKLILCILILAPIVSTFGQNQSFEFKATQEANVTLGKTWDYKYKPMKMPMVISVKNNKLTMKYETGKVFWEQELVQIIKTQETIEGGKITELGLALEFKENNFVGYVLYEYRNKFGEEYYTLKTPYILSDGSISSYGYYTIQ